MSKIAKFCQVKKKCMALQIIQKKYAKFQTNLTKDTNNIIITSFTVGYSKSQRAITLKTNQNQNLYLGVHLYIRGSKLAKFQI